MAVGYFTASFVCPFPSGVRPPHPPEGQSIAAKNVLEYGPKKSLRCSNAMDEEVDMAPQQAFDPQMFLAKIGAGRTIVACQKQSVIFSQGDAADSVFYIQDGQVKLTVVSEHGKEAVIAILNAQA